MAEVIATPSQPEQAFNHTAESVTGNVENIAIQPEVGSLAIENEGQNAQDNQETVPIIDADNLPLNISDQKIPVTSNSADLAATLARAEAAILEKLNHSATLIPTEFAALVADYRGKLV